MVRNHNDLYGQQSRTNLAELFFSNREVGGGGVEGSDSWISNLNGAKSTRKMNLCYCGMNPLGH